MKSINVIKEIKRVLNIQAQGIRVVSNAVDLSFSRAVKMIFRCRGKVIVTGIGKSGLVAQKVASTLSSTGTPAVYLHPTEGMHGSLGVVGNNDVVLAIGKSGESEEILNILPSIRKIGAKVISITSNQASSLARQSSIVLHIPEFKEACPLNLAPTTSSTQSLVVGDAIAIALMKLRDFSPENFALFHPGGRIGKRLLLKVSDVMRGGKRNPVVRLTASVDRLLVEITRKWAGAASIVDKRGKLVGLVTDFDIRRAFARGKQISRLSIKDLMNKKPIHVYSDDLAVKVLQMMESRTKPLTVIPVVNRKKKSVGMIHLHDLVIKGLMEEPVDR